MIKRVFDVVAAGAALFVLAPLLAIVAVLIKATSKGPVFFRHERIGLNYEPFNVLKFRTMEHAVGGASITAAGDARITPLGSVLRNYKLDELPQLLNVVRGEMSIVGPRPEVAKYVELDDRYNVVLQTRPGLTDPASLKFRHEQELLEQQDDPEAFYVQQLLPEKVGLAVDYVNNQSIRGDLDLIIRTLRAIAS